MLHVYVYIALVIMALLTLMVTEDPIQPRYIHVKQGVWVDTQASNLNAMNGDL